MKKSSFGVVFSLLLVAVVLFSKACWAADFLNPVEDVQKCDRALHVMAMLLVGFGFLMVFVKKYGRSALTATFLLVSVAIPLYICLNSSGLFGGFKPGVEGLILAEFAAAGLLICAGAVLGRLKMSQYILLGLLFVPCYMLNEWILLSGGLGLLSKGGFADTGGSIVIHAFGALFGLGLIMTMTTQKEFETPIETDAVSDRFSMLGSMVLWIFWPSFCAALVPVARVPQTVVNVVIALCGATLATYITSCVLRRKISIADIANASLAGGVAIGSTCDHANPGSSIIIGLCAGVLSVFGFAVIQSWLQKKIAKVDTCGVMYLHGLPGLMGGIAAVFVVSGLNNRIQLTGIVFAVSLAFLSGYVSGRVLELFGRRVTAYEDAEEFLDA
ncbi:MAG: ammonium transporter [Omnitrophica bacterium RIFOXYB12_FULL_50_7]|nr:MAG: ammonium transporter [Omnitrophica bacterium RIFOXYB12_FULL_50_7]